MKVSAHYALAFAVGLLTTCRPATPPAAGDSAAFVPSPLLHQVPDDAYAVLYTADFPALLQGVSQYATALLRGTSWDPNAERRSTWRDSLRASTLCTQTATKTWESIPLRRRPDDGARPQLGADCSAAGFRSELGRRGSGAHRQRQRATPAARATHVSGPRSAVAMLRPTTRARLCTALLWSPSSCFRATCRCWRNS